MGSSSSVAYRKSDFHQILRLLWIGAVLSVVTGSKLPSKKSHPIVFPTLQQKFDAPDTPHDKLYQVKICFESNHYEGYHHWKDSLLTLLVATRRGPHFYQCQDDLYPSHYEVLEYLAPIIQNHTQGLMDYLKAKQATVPSIKKFELGKDLFNEACVIVEELDVKLIEEISREFNETVKGIYENEEVNKTSIIEPSLQTAMKLFPKHTFTISVCFRPEAEYVKVREDYEKNLISSRVDDPTLNFGTTKPEYLKPSKYTVTEYLKNIQDEDTKKIREFIGSLKYTSAKIIPSKRHEIYQEDCLKITGAPQDLILDLEKQFTEIKEIRQSVLNHYD